MNRKGREVAMTYLKVPSTHWFGKTEKNKNKISARTVRLRARYQRKDRLLADCQLKFSAFLARVVFLPLGWRRHVPPKRWFLQDPHGAMCQKPVLFIVTAVKA
jgi:hypothetical protein